MGLKENLERVHERIRRAAERAGRKPEDVKLVVVTKYVDSSVVKELVRLGVKDIGENRAQDLVRKYDEVNDPNVTWHFIGRIQTNKIKYIVPRCEWIHSVYREEELEEIEKRASALGKVQKILVEVNVFGEETKAGVRPEEVEKFLELCKKYDHVLVLGLMTMAPYVEDPENVRWGFRRLREMLEELSKHNAGNVFLKELSMGMSNDFEIAVEEGATMVRIGSAIFEGGK